MILNKRTQTFIINDLTVLLSKFTFECKSYALKLMFDFYLHYGVRIDRILG